MLLPLTEENFRETPLIRGLDSDHFVVLKNGDDFDFDKIYHEFDDIHDEIKTYFAEMTDFPWWSAGGDGAIIAGGYLEAILQGRDPRDVDIFVIVRQRATIEEEQMAAKDVCDDIVRAICKKHAQARMVVKRHVVDLRTPEITYQIILKAYFSDAHVVGGFDIDSCRLAYDGTCVKAHFTAMRAWRNGWNLFSPITLSTSAVHRYAKKYRQGMGIMLAGTDRRTVQDMIEMAARREAIPTYYAKRLYASDIISIDKLIVHITNPDHFARNSISDYEFNWDQDAPSMEWFHPETSLGIHNLLVHELSDYEFRAYGRGFCVQRPDCRLSQRMFTGAYNPVKADIYIRRMPREKDLPVYAAKKPGTA